MIICFNCDKGTKAILDSFLSDGEYGGYDEVIISAIQNLSVLAGTMGDSGSVVLAGMSDSGESQYPAPTKLVSPKTGQAGRASQDDRDRNDVVVARSVPAFFKVSDALPESVVRASMVTDRWSAGGDVPMRDWLFGQYNKLLPAKVSCRGLASLLRDDPSGVGLDRARDRVSSEAARLCGYLTWLDQGRGRGRGELLATAFPKEGGEKSIRRYADQFVGSVSKSGVLSGMLVGLKLVNRVSEGDACFLGLTEAGVQFAALPNPLLDATGADVSAAKFSAEEREFLLGHIRENVVAEWYAYRMVISGVLEGADAPESLGNWLAENVPLGDGRAPSDAHLGSQKAGAVSRMIDLSLLGRSHEGAYVRYYVTDEGREFISS